MNVRAFLFFWLFLCHLPLAECRVQVSADPECATSAKSDAWHLIPDSWNGTALNIARAMATAGLVDKASGMAGIRARDLEMVDYAKKAAISSAVNTVMSVAIDHQDFKQAMLQGMASAAVNTVASWGAGQIGSAYGINRIDPVMHKILHTALGGASGAITAAVLGNDMRLAALSGATGAFVAEVMAEMLKPDVEVERSCVIADGLSKDEFEAAFMAKAQRSAQWANFSAAVAAFSVGLDVGVAHSAAINATEHNFLHMALLAASVACTAYEGYQIYQTYEREGGEAALKHLGISVATGAVAAGVIGMGFKVGKVFYPSLKQAFAAVVENNLILKATLGKLEAQLGKIEAYVRDQFNYRAHFAAEGVTAENVAVKIAPTTRESVASTATQAGRAGKQQRLRQLVQDDKLGSTDRGWIQQELNAIDRRSTRVSGSGDLKPQTNIRVPPGKELAHRRGRAAKDGYGYEHSDLQNIDLHKLQHKHEGYK